MTLDATWKVGDKSALELSTGRENFTGLALCGTPESPGPLLPKSGRAVADEKGHSPWVTSSFAVRIRAHQ